MNHSICLGIESSAHTFGVGIVDEKFNILANEKHSHSTTSGGLIPREVADHHLEHAKIVLQQALEKANISMEEVSCVAPVIGPGMGPALRVGATIGRFLSLQHKKPLIGVNHAVAHIEIGKVLTRAKDPLVLYVSGGNSQVIGFEEGYYRVYGETIDIGVGNLLDAFGREIGLGFPAGPKIDQLYFEAKEYIPLPYTVKGMDLVFSGLLTAAKQKVGKVDRTDLAYSLMHTAYAEITEITERALAHTNKKEVLVVGGVAASKALAKVLGDMCEARGTKLWVPPREAVLDNGAMAAVLGMKMFRAGIRHKLSDTRVNQKFRVDQVHVKWN